MTSQSSLDRHVGGVARHWVCMLEFYFDTLHNVKHVLSSCVNFDGTFVTMIEHGIGAVSPLTGDH